MLGFPDECTLRDYRKFSGGRTIYQIAGHLLRLRIFVLLLKRLSQEVPATKSMEEL
jgi:hypothetical protein